MDAYGPRQAIPEWLQPTAAAGIVTIAAAAAVISWLAGDLGIYDSYMRWVLRGILAIVALADVVTSRLTVRQMPPTEGVERTAATLVAAFAVAVAIMGAVGAILTGAWWYAPALAPVGLLLLFVNGAYVRERFAAPLPGSVS